MTPAVVYPFLEVFWTILVFFAFVVWLWLLFSVFADLFRRDDISGWVKVIWIVFIVVLPFIGVFAYLIVEHAGMTKRSLERQRAVQSQMDDYVRSVAGQGNGSPASEIARAKQLLDSGAISESEFEQIKRRALTH
jgi:Short C-terminal domain/Phospholipase_D-nuclease N-terminal